MNIPTVIKWMGELANLDGAGIHGTHSITKEHDGKEVTLGYVVSAVVYNEMARDVSIIDDLYQAIDRRLDDSNRRRHD